MKLPAMSASEQVVGRWIPARIPAAVAVAVMELDRARAGLPRPTSSSRRLALPKPPLKFMS